MRAGQRDWTLDAACRGADPDVFLPSELPDGRTQRPPVNEALRYCAVCPVVAECAAEADAATDYPMVGVWGGRYVKHYEADKRRMGRKRELQRRHNREGGSCHD